jgi:hypothetical protein
MEGDEEPLQTLQRPSDDLIETDAPEGLDRPPRPK